MITEIISHTPTWVFVVFAVVAWRGISAMRERPVQPASLIVIALIFLVYGAQAGLSHAGDTPWPSAAWLLALIAGVALGALSVRRSHVFAATSGARQAGSVMPLILILAIFSSRYVVGALSAMHPEMLESLTAQLSICAVYGALSGVMVGRALRIVMRARALAGPGAALPAAF